MIFVATLHHVGYGGAKHVMRLRLTHARQDRNCTNANAHDMNNIICFIVTRIRWPASFQLRASNVPDAGAAAAVPPAATAPAAKTLAAWKWEESDDAVKAYSVLLGILVRRLLRDSHAITASSAILPFRLLDTLPPYRISTVDKPTQDTNAHGYKT